MMKVFWNGRYQAIDEVGVHPNDRGFLLGDGVYEVVRIYRGRCFEMAAHEKRLVQSAASIGIALEGFQGMTEIVKNLLSKNSLPNGDGILYYQITRGTAPRKHFFPEPAVQANHYAYVQLLAVPDISTRPGASVVTLPDRRWLECHIKSIALLGSVLAVQKAKELHASEAVLHRDGVVTEGSHTNVFAVIDGVLKTHPANHLVLNGITRRVVLQLAKSSGVTCQESVFNLTELKSASEVFLTGTTVEIWPIIQLDGNPVGKGEIGPVTKGLQSLFDRSVDRLP
jgi:D-alanine transaminase